MIKDKRRRRKEIRKIKKRQKERNEGKEGKEKEQKQEEKPIFLADPEPLKSREKSVSGVQNWGHSQ